MEQINQNKILFVFGTRPEAIKMAPLCRRFLENPNWEAKICLTAQHRELLDQVMQLYQLDADYDLNLMQANQSLSSVTSRVLLGLENIFLKWKPDWIFVHGDTNTSFAAALAASYNKIQVAHVEAGLRTKNKWAPFPEEINRRLTGHVCDLHFAPTQTAKSALIKESIPESSIFVTGNTVIDSLFQTLENLNSDKNWLRQIKTKFSFLHSSKKKILITCHRRENFGQGIQQVCQALKILAKNDFEIIYPVHPNPNIQKVVGQQLSELENVHLLAPLDYKEFVYFMQQCDLILTDSGGVQEEAPSLGKPVLVLRDVSERPEAVSAGTVMVIGTDEQKIVKTTLNLLSDRKSYLKMSEAHNPYGDGKAVDRIEEIFQSWTMNCPIKNVA